MTEAKTLSTPSTSSKTLKWLDKRDPEYSNANPKERYQDLLLEFGEPSFLAPQSGGFAIWNADTLSKQGKVYSEVKIMDEMVPNLEPNKHYDFVYASVQFTVPLSQIPDMVSISPSITFDRLKGVITARSDRISGCLALILLALRVAQEEVDANEVVDQDLLKTYTENVSKDFQKKKEYERVISNYLEDQSSQLSELERTVEEEDFEYGT